MLVSSVEGMVVRIIGREGGCTHDSKEGGVLFGEVSDARGEEKRGGVVFVRMKLRIQGSPAFDGNEASDISASVDMVV